VFPDFNNVLQAAFALADPKSAKKDTDDLMSFYAFGIYEHKSFL
jgi:hypothetical protein